ncbi:MAG: methylaspartate mutase, partial [Candidatus Sumerlaeaceae bacterium]
DSIFMMPHLGVLGELAPEAAMEVFWRDCLVPLGAVVAPAGRIKPGRLVLEARIERAGHAAQELVLHGGELKRVELPEGAEAKLVIAPARGMDVGAGRGRRVERRVWGGKVGIVFDGRGRPIQVASDQSQKREQLMAWARAIGAWRQS